MPTGRALCALVRSRAASRCEYCRMPQALDPLPFQLDHIIARVHRGPTIPDNLALACFACNHHKGTNLAGIDPATAKLVRLFDPRRQEWKRHFRWRGARLAGRTPCGRATAAVRAAASGRNRLCGRR